MLNEIFSLILRLIAAMTMNTVVANSVLFLLAGYDTVAGGLSFMTYLLAKNTECQDQLRKELEDIIEKDGEFNYQNVMEAKYLDGCVSGKKIIKCCTAAEQLLVLRVSFKNGQNHKKKNSIIS